MKSLLRASSSKEAGLDKVNGSLLESARALILMSKVTLVFYSHLTSRRLILKLEMDDEVGERAAQVLLEVVLSGEPQRIEADLLRR